MGRGGGGPKQCQLKPAVTRGSPGVLEGLRSSPGVRSTALEPGHQCSNLALPLDQPCDLEQVTYPVSTSVSLSVEWE